MGVHEVRVAQAILPVGLSEAKPSPSRQTRRDHRQESAKQMLPEKHTVLPAICATRIGRGWRVESAALVAAGQLADAGHQVKPGVAADEAGSGGLVVEQLQLPLAAQTME